MQQGDRTLISCLRTSDAGRFLAVFAIFCALSMLAIVGALAVLQRGGMLPAAPVTATWCFNMKFAFLREASLSDRTLVAVGSSATWRNLDMSVFERQMAGTRALNAAPCFLQRLLLGSGVMGGDLGSVPAGPL